MQYVSQQGMRSSLNSTLPPPPGLGTGQQGSDEVVPSNINVCPTSSDAGFPVLSDTAVSTTCPVLNNPMGTFSGNSITDEDQFGTDMPMDHRKRSSWHTIWSNSLATPGPLAQYHTNQQTQLMRRLSLRFTNSIGSNSSGSTSGFGSATFGSSFSAVGDTSFDSSRRSSRNACASDISDAFRPAVQSNVGHVTIADENFLSGWTATTDSGLSVIGAAKSPRALLGSGSLMSATRHSMTGTGCGNVRAEFGHGLNNPLTVVRTNSPGSAGTNNTDVFEDTTRLPCEVGAATHVTPGSGRRHHSTSCVTAGKGGGPSFWPSDPDSGCKSRVCDNSDTQGRKVVSRKGNIFKPRQDFTVFQTLPVHKRNAYFIQMDDDSCTGNEDTRAFLLAQLTNHRISEVSCLACHQALIVYDHFPVVDGIFFISPICHRSTSPCGRRSTGGLRVTWHTNGIPTGIQPSKLSGANADLEEVSQGYVHKLLGSGLMVVPPPGCLGPRQQIAGNHAGPDGNDTVQHHSHSHQYHYPYHQQHNSTTGRHGGGGRQERYLHALCMNCLHAGVPENSEDAAVATERTGGIYCRSCLRPWSGATLLVGGLYTYDVLAAWPCCPDRLTCNTCGRHLVTTSDSTTANGRSEPAGNVEKENANVGQQFNLTYPFPFFSQYSQLITCPYCSKVDYHFVKQFDQQFRADIGSQFRSGTG
ncbi:hypothetical protein FGIG_00504 [Fasciola gigantica]|uniref:Headcase middle domain-containing protein n=1 Tax=Fasciola gigantica TaxID=46835 RepID=A0A504Z7S9_FASGI|nr:hypothetical protein FGIG_00504 [Fasciola gigantica]